MQHRQLRSSRYPPLPRPSALTLSRRPFPDSPPAIVVRLVLGLRRFLQRLADALTPANLVMFEMTTGLAIAHMLGAVARFGIVDELARGARYCANARSAIGAR